MTTKSCHGARQRRKFALEMMREGVEMYLCYKENVKCRVILRVRKSKNLTFFDNEGKNAKKFRGCGSAKN